MRNTLSSTLHEESWPDLCIFPALLHHIASRLSTILYYTTSLLLALGHRPLWRLVLAVIFELVALFFGLVHRVFIVLCRGIDCKEAEGGRAGVDDCSSALISHS